MLTATLLLFSTGAVQTTQAPDSGFTIPAIQTETPPDIDGVIGDGEWPNAAHATDFIRFEPQRGTPSLWRTDAMVPYDSSQIYVAFVVWDPDAPAAQLTRRDAHLLNDDAVVLLLDTHNDKQSAYYFMTNLLGTQTDGRVANDGRTVDDTWDAVELRNRIPRRVQAFRERLSEPSTPTQYRLQHARVQLPDEPQINLKQR